MKRVVTDQFKKSSLVAIRFLPNEKKKLKQLAVEQKKTLSGWLRAIALQQIESLNQKKVVPEINRRLYFKLGQVSEKLQTLDGQNLRSDKTQEQQINSRSNKP